MYNLKQNQKKLGIFCYKKGKIYHKTGGAIIESGTPSKTQLSESNKSEKLASFINVLSSKLFGSIHEALFKACWD